MAEPEELISDAARSATEFTQALWQRYRPPAADGRLHLSDFTSSLTLLLQALFETDFPIRIAQTPPRATLLAILFNQHPAPRRHLPIAATDGRTLWLPPISPSTNREESSRWYRTLALQQAMRATRGSATEAVKSLSPLQRALYLLLEAQACDILLTNKFPGCIRIIQALRETSLQQRPDLPLFKDGRRVLEQHLRTVLRTHPSSAAENLPFTNCPADSLQQVPAVLADWSLDNDNARGLGRYPLLQDNWTGDLVITDNKTDAAFPDTQNAGQDNDTQKPARSARLPRTPEIRKPKEGEDEPTTHASPWMVQLDEPHRIAQDPMGLQRPADRDQDTAAEQYADMVSELDQARLIRTPEKAKEFLLSDSLSGNPITESTIQTQPAGEGLHYPEWDYRTQCYRHPGARLFVLPAANGSQEWVDSTLQSYRAQIRDIRRHFEMLKARRTWIRRQRDGDEIDFDAYIDTLADYSAGYPLSQRLYQTNRAVHRDMAIGLLVDISGSTDSWISQHRRIIDVEREALLLLCIALDRLNEPWMIQAFSGNGPQAVTVRELKAFSESYSADVALRISSLEPDNYTRAGAAIRHATAKLMQQPAQHRLLLLLSDGKPNDKDEYEGRYGAEDMRQAVTEAKLQGIQPFCLTIDRQAAGYLPQIFGARQYALLQQPERLPQVLLEWMKRLIMH